jgi:membrane-bound lytic murein transglycosylase A
MTAAATRAELPGWGEDAPAFALAAFARVADAPDGRVAPRLRALAAEAATAPAAAARAFVEARFAPVPPRDDAAPGLLTGYHEPTLPAALAPSPRFRTPIFAPPPDPLRGLPRAAIRAGALAGRGLELFWLDDPVEAFFLETQGSGRLRLPDGALRRVGFAARNGRPWRSPGRMLVEAGEIAAETVSAAAVKTWLRAHPARAEALLDACEAVAFFETRDLDPDDGPLGALGLPLTPERSIAVDAALHGLGGLFWLDAETCEGPLRRLVVAQDVGGAIRGPHRADLFRGWDAGAEARAGGLVAPLRLTPLAPRGDGP